MSKSAIVVVDLGYGDAGKGKTVDWLTREYRAHIVVRYNGGPQCGHNVVLPNGTHHTFAQFGSGTLAGARTYLSQYVLVNPFYLYNEYEALGRFTNASLEQLTCVHPDCLIITPYHQIINRLRELSRGKDTHGTCGQGIGETRSDSFDKVMLLAKDLDSSDDQLRRKLQEIRAFQKHKLTQFVGNLDTEYHDVAWQIGMLNSEEYLNSLVEEYRSCPLPLGGEDYFDEIMATDGVIIFEGAQGILLDEAYGFYPYVTWTKTTSSNAYDLMWEHPDTDIKKIAVIRSYSTRHGAGPFVPETQELQDIPEPHNDDFGMQGVFRRGHLDLPALSYAAGVDPYWDGLIITHIDPILVRPSWKLCTEYQRNGNIIRRFPRQILDTKDQTKLTNILNHCQPIHEEYDTKNILSILGAIADAIGIPIVAISDGPTHRKTIALGRIL